MAQRLVMGMALVGEPDLLILDEPSTGRRDRLENVAELYAFLEVELPAMWDRWGQWQASRRS